MNLFLFLAIEGVLSLAFGYFVIGRLWAEELFGVGLVLLIAWAVLWEVASMGLVA